MNVLAVDGRYIWPIQFQFNANSIKHTIYGSTAITVTPMTAT